MKALKHVTALMIFIALGAGTPAQANSGKTSGVYLTVADYQQARLAYEGDCRSKAHKLELHDVLNKPYIDVTHEAEKRRLAKNELFGFRACDGRDYRFGRNLEYQILEAKELYIYAREISRSHGKGFHTDLEYSFSAGADAPILALTLENLKQAVPDNHKFHDSLDATFAGGEKLSQYDTFHKMFKVNRLLIASREP